MNLQIAQLHKLTGKMLLFPQLSGFFIAIYHHHFDIIHQYILDRTAIHH